MARYMRMAAKAAGPDHHYTFELFALDTKLKLGPAATQEDLLEEMNGHILMKGVLVKRFHHPGARRRQSSRVRRIEHNSRIEFSRRRESDLREVRIFRKSKD
jgi:hypothetical protein